tara:strand:- start:7701 stop:8447 length:747 start_codon:yes stop_codon:yes gene_type:complete
MWVYNYFGENNVKWSLIKKCITIIALLSGCIACCNKIPNFSMHLNNLAHREVSADQATYLITADLSFMGIYTGLSNSGSGFGISYTGSKTVVITAGHVCEPMGDEINFTTEFSVITIEGEMLNAVDIIISDTQDICAITVDSILPIAKLAQEEPEVGDKLGYSGYPLGLYMPGIRHYFSGYMGGKDPDLNHIYNVPTVGGSSGSPVYNERKEVVGLISAVLKDFEHITLGVGLLNIKKFLEKNDLVNN